MRVETAIEPNIFLVLSIDSKAIVVDSTVIELNQQVNMYLNYNVFRPMVIGLLLMTSITTCNSTLAQETGGTGEQVFSSDGSGELLYQGRSQTYYLHTPRSYLVPKLKYLATQVVITAQR